VRNITGRTPRKLPITALALALIVALGMLATGGARPPSGTEAGPTFAFAQLLVAQAAQPSDQSKPIKLLKVEPVKGYTGDHFTVTGDGLAAGKQVEFFWTTVDAAYSTKVMPDNVEYH